MRPPASTGLAEILTALAAGEACRALALYLDGYPELAARSSLEWSLAEGLVGRGGLSGEREVVPAVPAWPADLLARPSGAALAFVAAQLAGADLPLPAGLSRLAPIPHSQRAVIAAAWQVRPEGIGRIDAGLRSRLALWLCEAPAAVGSCLLAAAALDDAALVRRLGPLWLRVSVHPLVS